MKQRQINKIIQKRTLHESCDKWTKEVWNAINQVGKIVTKKTTRKDLRELQKIRKNFRIKIQNTTVAFKKRILKDRLKLLKVYIKDKIKEGRGNRIKQTKTISNNIDNGRKILEVKQRVKRWNFTLYNKQWRKKNRKQRKNVERISLLKTRPPENLKEEKIEQDIITNFQKLVDDEQKSEVYVTATGLEPTTT